MAAVQISPARASRLAIYYCLLLAAVWAFSQGYDRRFWDWMAAHLPRRLATVILGILPVMIVLIGLAVLQLPDGRMHIAFLDVGEGDAILITTRAASRSWSTAVPAPWH